MSKNIITLSAIPMRVTLGQYVQAVTGNEFHPATTRIIKQALALAEGQGK